MLYSTLASLLFGLKGAWKRCRRQALERRRWNSLLGAASWERAVWQASSGTCHLERRRLEAAPDRRQGTSRIPTARWLASGTLSGNVASNVAGKVGADLVRSGCS